MEEIDKFFVKVDKKYQQKKQLSTDSNKSSNPSFSNINNHGSGKRLDDYLGEIMDNFQEKKADQEDLFQDLITSKNNINDDDIFADVKSKFVEQKNQKRTPKLNDSKLTEIQSQYQHKKTQTQVTKPLDIEAIKKEELNKQRRRKALVKQAEQWLNKLDPYSDEGFWFQQFAESYESKLEAAIDYLDVLNHNK
jgi:hypothetical protein